MAQAVPTGDEGRGGITATGLVRHFGSVAAVQGMDFRAVPGAVTALIGPNGSGKTTLLLMLASLLRPDAGTISVCGIDVGSDPREVRALLGWMPDTLGVWEALTAREILVTVGRLYGLGPAAAAAKAGELLELAKLEALADAPARTFSRGQQQRLSLARSLVNDPSVLLLDEPASGLDPGARVDLRILLRRLAAEGRTVVVSSHVLSELDEMADHAVFVSAGRTVRAQSVAEAGAGSRRYAIRTLDAASLSGALAATGAAADWGAGFTRPPGAGEPGTAMLALSSEAEAAELLAHLVRSGVPVSSFAPAAGVLEETYLSLGENER